MPTESLSAIRQRLAGRLAEIERELPRLEPEQICGAMEAIRTAAAKHGLVALEGLADWSAHHAMMPGYKVATAESLSHWHEALDSEQADDREAILAALALRCR